MTKLKRPIVIPDMPAEEYHEIEALSASGIVLLDGGPLDFYYYRYGDGKSKASTPAQLLGRAKHTAGLEGLDAFEIGFMPALDLEDYPGALVYHADLKQWCKERNLPPGGTISVLCERIEEAADILEEHPIIWPRELARHELAASDAGATILPLEDYNDALEKAKLIAPYIDSMRDRGGLAEATILWERGGIPCKARLDFFAPGSIFDLKNMANKYRSKFSSVVHREMANSLLTVQAAWYLAGARAARDAGVLPFDDRGLDFTFKWAFVQQNGAPNIIARDYQEEAEALDDGTMYRTAADRKTWDIIDQAIALYARYSESHGKDRPWIPPLDDQPMTDLMYPFWFLSSVMNDDEVEV